MEAAIKKIQENFKRGQDYILMFSGGADSSSILGVAKNGGINIKPVWVNNGFNRATKDEIEQQAKNLGASDLKIVPVKAGSIVCSNPYNRCYFCKSDILNKIFEPGSIIIDGTTKSDSGNYRPGLKALDEFSVKSILAESGIEKYMATEIASHFGADLNIAGMESCLATRFNYGMEITEKYVQALREIERFIISETGDYNVRCRIDDEDHMRIELKYKESYVKFTDEEFRKKIINLSQGITMFVTLDLMQSRPNEYDKKIKHGF